MITFDQFKAINAALDIRMKAAGNVLDQWRGFCTLNGKRISRMDYTRAWIDVRLAQWLESERAAA